MLVEDEDLARVHKAISDIYVRYCSRSESTEIRLPISFDCIEKNAREIKRLRSIRSMMEQSLSSIDSIIARRDMDFLHLSQNRQRCYLIRRRTEDKNSPPNWEELQIRGELWNRANGSIETIRGLRDRHNENEKIRKPTLRESLEGVSYFWQIWAYDPETGFWSVLE